MWNTWLETPRGRTYLSAGIALSGHLLFAGLAALILVNFTVPAPEFVELNMGRFSRDQLMRMIHESEKAVARSSPGKRATVPTKRLPEIDMPAISPSAEERMMMPDQVSLDAEKTTAVPVRPPGSAIVPMPTVVGVRKAVYEGARLDLGSRPGEGIESEHVGSDIKPIFLIEGQLRGRRFHKAALTETPEMPARTQIRLDVVVDPGGNIISVLVARKENAKLEEFATNFIRRCRFDALPTHMPQQNQTGRSTITFTVRAE
jgi:hypothetical protein